MTDTLPFERKYFIQSETSNYQDYRKRKWEILTEDLIEYLKLNSETRILDFGCATGGLINELKSRGIKKVKGTDISYWAIKYGKKNYKLEKELDYYNVNLLTEPFDIILFLDVLEHVPTLEELIELLNLANSSILILRLPVSKEEGQNYVLPVSRNDATHVHCHTKEWWIKLLTEANYSYSYPLKGQAIYDSEGVFAGVFKKCR